MNLSWEIDDANIVKAKFSVFGKTVVSVNGIEVPNRLSLRKKGEFPFELSDGRSAIILITPQFGTRPVIELRVEGQLKRETGKEPIKCESCGTAVKPNDRFCGVCGHQMPPAEHYVHQRYIKEATRAIKLLAVLFFIFGVILFFVTKMQAANALVKLNGMSPDETFPKSINGVTYTVAALRKQLMWEPWGILIQNMILAAVMTGLLRNPIFLDRHSGFDWTVIPILSGQCFSVFLPAVVAV